LIPESGLRFQVVKRMVAVLGRWEIRTESKISASDAVVIRRRELKQPGIPPAGPDLELAAGDFIARQVLEKDADFFDG
jgi:hypothetical protein